MPPGMYPPASFFPSPSSRDISFPRGHDAHRWTSVITHVPCGGSRTHPAGRLLISATLEEMDGPNGRLGSAGPSSYSFPCYLPREGFMRFDIADIMAMEAGNYLGGIIEHEMGHVIGVG